ncbi:uncharacterized protein LOC121969810 isoform X2 [Zingiber officinale]|uniref:uncharacterized protein LOC121969810 isoform X2 n=1 Tax=Zingiber officinale TaxID=94328 RepID=UPI001C4D4692|nr:uncharacterized protein LOC121969810 isoform X2 [Zingiber officinale]
MFFSDEAGDGPAILKLQNWGHLKCQLQLSEFSAACISPSKELLLLLSNLEAVLLPLVSGKESCKLANQDDSRSSSAASVLSPIANVQPDSFHDVVDWTEVVPFSDIGQKGTYSVFDYYPVISNVNSLAWGHYGDSYGRPEDYSFREFLIVSNNQDITLHAFRNENTDTIESYPEDADANGVWMRWSSIPSPLPNEQFLHSHNKNYFCEIDGKTGNSGKLHIDNQMGDIESSCGRPKSWLCSFLSELDLSESDSKHIGLFPPKSSFPHSADVVSFSIYRSSLAFLAHTCPLNQQECHSGRNLNEILDDEFISELSGNFQSKIKPEDTSYNCSKVFSSSSHKLIGLVLTTSAGSSIKSCENSVEYSNHTFVVVIMLHWWGIQWVCSVNLEDSYPGSGRVRPWADFQFSGNYLVCLNSSGLVRMWVADTGQLIAQFETVQCCEVGRWLPFNGLASFENSNLSDVDHGTNATNIRTFRKLVVTSHSLHLAIVDVHGVVYLVYASDYISEKHQKPKQLIPHSEHSDLGLLAGWKVAGYFVGVQQSFIGLPDAQEFSDSTVLGQYFASTDQVNLKQRVRFKKQFVGEEKQSHTFQSGFGATSSPVNDSRIGNCGSKNSVPMRRIILPLDRVNDDCICLSPFGITRVVKCCNMKEQKGHRVVHTDIHMNCSVLDERDFYSHGKFRRCSSAVNDSFCLGESLGCLFQGFLYLVTSHGLSVVLPSVSVSTALFPYLATRYSPPCDFASCNFDNTSIIATCKPNESLRPWQIEVLDRVVLFDGPREAEHVCLENGWDLREARFRQMQLALQHLKFDVIQQSLDMLADVNLAEEGILLLLFVCVHEMCCCINRDADLASVSSDS